MNSIGKIMSAWCCVFAVFVVPVVCSGATTPFWGRKTTEPEKIEQMRAEAEQAKREAAQKQFEKAKVDLQKIISQIDLPQDTSVRMTAKELRISGNTLTSTAKLIKRMPLIYNDSDKALTKAESSFLYDFRVLKDIALNPGTPRQISARTIQGLTRYILSEYRAKNYAGIFVYVPTATVLGGTQLRDEILSIRVMEAPVTDVTVKTYDPNQNETEKGYLRHSAVEAWSPVKPGRVANQKELDDFVNLLNLNPDRYVSAVVTKGTEPNSLAVRYDIYEANPWHWFAQIDNSGTQERQWNPRVGVINTNLLGYDDIFTTIYQSPWDATIQDNYSLFGSYDFPLVGQKLRLKLYGGYSEFDITPESGLFDFLGSGTFYGGILRYNLLQAAGWFVDLKGTIEHTRSKVNTSIFPSALGSDVQFWLAGAGVDIHKTEDMSRTSLGFDWYKSLGGESDAAMFTKARTNSDSDFAIYTANASHSQYMDPNKISRLSSSVRWIGSNERLAPAKMTSFGGMYSVRGYDEYEFVADGGILASIQYEYDLVKAGQAQEKKTEKPFLRKLVPLAFFDYGRAKVRHPISTERGHEELFSVGPGLIVELGDHFSGAVYYGYPLTPTPDTREGKGRVYAGMMLRW